jgi:hypothetical protein
MVITSLPAALLCCHQAASPAVIPRSARILLSQHPRAWLARLRPMATGQLTASLARTAATPALWRLRQATAGRAAAEQIRDLTPASVIFTHPDPPDHLQRQP